MSENDRHPPAKFEGNDEPTLCSRQKGPPPMTSTIAIKRARAAVPMPKRRPLPPPPPPHSTTREEIPAAHLAPNSGAMSEGPLLKALFLLAPLVGFGTFIALDVGFACADVAVPSAAAVDISRPVVQPPEEAHPPPEPSAETPASAPGADPADPAAAMTSAAPPTVAVAVAVAVARPRQHSARGDQLRARGWHARARTAYAAALEIDPRERWALAGMARSYLEQGNAQQALAWSRLIAGDVAALRGDIGVARRAWRNAAAAPGGASEASHRLSIAQNPYVER